MPGGRPPKEGAAQRFLELEELSAWFRQAMADAGYESPHAVVRAELAHKNAVYDLHNATRFLPLQIVRAIAVGLRRDPDEVESLWLRAKQGMERAEEERQSAEAPRLTSWTQLPKPTLAVSNLVEAQSKAVERLPYDMLGVEEPPLSAVYVRQRIRTSVMKVDGGQGPGGVGAADPVRRADGPRRDGDEESADSVLPAPDALARHEHLLITGEPGAGKSTFSSHLAWTLSRIWLRKDSGENAPLAEPVIPVRIAARALVGRSGSWSAVLRQAVCRSLGSALVTEPDVGLFAGRVLGARWLVMVDGLDEIADRDARVGVIRTLAQHARAGSDYRFVVTSRPLPEAELAPLRGPLVGAYRMEPFGETELRDFAGKWFAAQYEGEAERARATADRFLEEAEDSRIKELVHNPLLATIAAVNATVAPARPLPTSRLSLYQHFCDHLLSRGHGRPAARATVRGHFEDDPERRDFRLRLDRHKRELLGVLGRCRLEGEGSLWEAAVEWARQWEGAPHEGWDTDLADFLQSTGLLVSEGDDYRFLHHSFAEFIAARSYAESITPDFPDMEDWIRRGFTGDDRTLAVFVFCMWAQRVECPADLVAERLLDGAPGGHQRPLLAGMLLAEGVAFGELHRTRVLDHLEAIGRSALDAEDSKRAFEVLGALGQRPEVLALLDRIASSEGIYVSRRLYAVDAYSRAGDPHVAERLLRACLGGLYSELPRAARVACALGDTARDAVRDRARAMATEPDTDDYELSYGAETLVCLGEADEAARMARAALGVPTAGTGCVRRAAEAWLAVGGPGAVAELEAFGMRRVAGGQGARLAVAEALDKEGEPEAAARIAGEVLAGGSPSAADLAQAVQIWMAVRGGDGAAEVWAAVRASGADAGHSLQVPGVLVQPLAEFAHEEEIANLARGALAQHAWGGFLVGELLRAWVNSSGAPAVEAIMKATGEGRQLCQYDRSTLADALLEAGHNDRASALAEGALRTPNAIAFGYTRAAKVLLKTRGEDAGPRLTELWREVPGLAQDSAWLRGVLSALPQHEATRTDATISHLARELVALSSASADDVSHALRILTRVEGREAAPYLVEVARTPGRLLWAQGCDIARELAAMRETAHAHELWRYLLGNPSPPQGAELSLLIDIQAAEATHEAAGWIRHLIADPETYAPRRLRLRQLLAWLEAAGPEAAAGASIRNPDVLTPAPAGDLRAQR
ncbi:NACHT domain-containing protein [Streptomyces sp. NBC_01187]|uniref:NACHT domain-containing protein n=1 Tax=Streptomyces sp. NBC_01187 TaxID=2903766 RepID=UPI00386FA394|nr:hypothetical protein OG220_29565 [Streptomyces sp. NBC_01187]